MSRRIETEHGPKNPYRPDLHPIERVLIAANFAVDAMVGAGLAGHAIYHPVNPLAESVGVSRSIPDSSQPVEKTAKSPKSHKGHTPIYSQRAGMDHGVNQVSADARLAYREGTPGNTNGHVKAEGGKLRSPQPIVLYDEKVKARNEARQAQEEFQKSVDETRTDIEKLHQTVIKLSGSGLDTVQAFLDFTEGRVHLSQKDVIAGLRQGALEELNLVLTRTLETKIHQAEKTGKIKGLAKLDRGSLADLGLDGLLGGVSNSALKKLGGYINDITRDLKGKDEQGYLDTINKFLEEHGNDLAGLGLLGGGVILSVGIAASSSDRKRRNLVLVAILGCVLLAACGSPASNQQDMTPGVPQIGSPTPETPIVTGATPTPDKVNLIAGTTFSRNYGPGVVNIPCECSFTQEQINQIPEAERDNFLKRVDGEILEAFETQRQYNPYLTIDKIRIEINTETGKPVLYFIHTGQNGNEELYLAAADGSGLLPAMKDTNGNLIANLPLAETVAGAVYPATHPDYTGAAGGEIPEYLKALYQAEDNSIDESMRVQGIDPGKQIKAHERGFVPEFHWGSARFNPDNTFMYWSRDLTTGKLFLRPDRRPDQSLEPWKWDKITPPPGMEGKGKFELEFSHEYYPQAIWTDMEGNALAWFDAAASDGQGVWRVWDTNEAVIKISDPSELIKSWGPEFSLTQTAAGQWTVSQNISPTESLTDTVQVAQIETQDGDFLVKFTAPVTGTETVSTTETIEWPLGQIRVGEVDGVKRLELTRHVEQGNLNGDYIFWSYDFKTGELSKLLYTTEEIQLNNVFKDEKGVDFLGIRQHDYHVVAVSPNDKPYAIGVIPISEALVRNDAYRGQRIILFEAVIPLGDSTSGIWVPVDVLPVGLVEQFDRYVIGDGIKYKREYPKLDEIPELITIGDALILFKRGIPDDVVNYVNSLSAEDFKEFQIALGFEKNRTNSPFENDPGIDLCIKAKAGAADVCAPYYVYISRILTPEQIKILEEISAGIQPKARLTIEGGFGFSSK